MFNKKFNISTTSLTDLGFEETEIVLVESIYYAESHVKSESRGNPYRVKNPNRFWREEVRSLKDDWAKERAQMQADWAKKEAKMQAQITELKEQADEAAKWRKTAEDYDANCDHLRRKFFNEQANHQRTKDELKAEINQLKADAKSKEDLVAKREIGIARAAGDVARLKEENKILRNLAIILNNRVESWQAIAKNQFRKNKELEIEAICNECRIDEAYNKIRELEADLNEKDVIIEEIIISAEEAAEEWAKATEEAEIKAYKLAVELAEKNWIISQYKEKEETEEMYAEATSVGNLITVAKEIAGYEIDQVFIEAGSDRPTEYEITRQELNNKIICGLVQIREEATDIESLWRVERICKEIDDILNNFSSLTE